MSRIIRFLRTYVSAALSCAYLFTIGLFSSRNRSLLYRIAGHFGHDWRSTRPVLPTIEMPQLVNDGVSVQVREPMGGDGSVWLIELLVMAMLIRIRQPGILFEIGTFDGRTTLNMAANSPPGAQVHTLDLPKKQMGSTELGIVETEKAYIDKEESGGRYRGTDCEEKIVQWYGDSASFDFSSFQNAVDFVFVDGSHSYEYVLNDSRVAMRLLRNGQGVVLWHDYGVWEGVTRALNELYSEGGAFSLLRHVKDTSLAVLVSE